MSFAERDPYGVPTDILAMYKYAETVNQFSNAIGDAQAELITQREQGTYQPGQYFTLLGISTKAFSERTTVETVLKVGERVVITRAEGKTQADALTQAMKMGLVQTYPSVAQIELIGEQVDVKGDVGSQIQAKLTFRENDTTWKSMTVRDRRREAVEQAVTDAFDYTLTKS